MKYCFLLQMLLLAVTCCAGQDINQGILSPNRIDYVQYSYDIDWSFMGDEELDKLRMEMGCGVRFIEGAFETKNGISKIKVVEILDEFCKEISDMNLHGSYFVKLRDTGRALWVERSTPVYFWRNDELVLIYRPWLGNFLKDGKVVPCKEIVIGPFETTDNNETRTCYITSAKKVVGLGDQISNFK